jgi:hypothetical protein
MRPKKRRRNFEPNISTDNPRVGFLAKGASAPRGTKKLDVGTACQPHIPKIYILSTKIPSPPSLISPARCSISHPGSNPKNPHRRDAAEEKGSGEGSEDADKGAAETEQRGTEGEADKHVAGGVG